MQLKRILHVDDDQDIRTIVQLALEVVGNFEITQSASHSEALEVAIGLNPQLLLLDVMMPGMSGPELWAQLTDQTNMAETPVIFVTAKVEDEFSQQLVREGALAVISKPFDPMTLADQIAEIWKQWQTKDC